MSVPLERSVETVPTSCVYDFSCMIRCDSECLSWQDKAADGRSRVSPGERLKLNV